MAVTPGGVVDSSVSDDRRVERGALAPVHRTIGDEEPKEMKRLLVESFRDLTETPLSEGVSLGRTLQMGR
jgi:hypothetical protein